MIDTLFLEDSDLLENVNIMESIFTPSYENLINEVITENEMMISIYETQQFLIEQDTQIFMALDYVSESHFIIQEGVFENIGKAIMAVLRKIKELISRFIAFITGNRKKEKTDANMSAEQLEKEIDKTIRPAEDAADKFSDEKLDELSKKMIEKYHNSDVYKNNHNTQSNQTQSQNSKETEQKQEGQKQKVLLIVDKLKEEIDEIKNAKKYTPIKMSPTVLEKFNFNKSLNDVPEIKDLINATNQCIDILKDDKQMDRFKYVNRANMEETLKKYGYNDILKIESEDAKDSDFYIYDSEFELRKKGGDSMGYIYTSDDKVNRDEYYKKYYKDECKFFNKYSDKSRKHIDDMANTLHNVIRPLEKELEQITNKRGEKYESPGLNMIYNRLSKYIRILSNVYTDRIKNLTAVERSYSIYLQNMKIFFKDNKKLIELEKKYYKK